MVFEDFLRTLDRKFMYGNSMLERDCFPRPSTLLVTDLTIQNSDGSIYDWHNDNTRLTGVEQSSLVQFRRSDVVCMVI